MAMGWGESHKPAAAAHVHLLIAGLMWTVVGTALAGVGARWLWRSPSWTAPLLVISTVDAIPIAPLREFFRTNRVRVTD